MIKGQQIMPSFKKKLTNNFQSNTKKLQCSITWWTSQMDKTSTSSNSSKDLLTIGILSKLQNMTNCNTLFIYHSLLGSQLYYGTSLWEQMNTENQKQNETKITFKKHFDQTDLLYKELNIMSKLSMMENLEITTTTILDQLLRNSWTYLYINNNINY